MVLDEIYKNIEANKETGKELLEVIKRKVSQINIKKNEIKELKHEVIELEVDLERDIEQITTKKQELISLEVNLKEAIEQELEELKGSKRININDYFNKR